MQGRDKAIEKFSLLRTRKSVCRTLPQTAERSIWMIALSSKVICLFLFMIIPPKIKAGRNSHVCINRITENSERLNSMFDDKWSWKE